jgi:hypothetical protein
MTRNRPRDGFTLFELILSVALAATLLALIGTAINLYLTRVESDRSRVEEVQLARSVLTMISDDLRSASVYQKQDMSAVAKLLAAGTPFNVDSIDAARQTGGPGGTGGTGKAGAAAVAAKLSALASKSGSTGGTSGSSGSSSASGTGSNQEPDDTMPLGVNGAADQVYVDVTRIPRQEELFATTTGYTNAPSQASTKSGSSSTSAATSDAMPPADLKTVHYFVRQGDAVAPGSVAVTSLAAEAQATAGGLVREEVPRRMRVFGEETGTNSTSDTNAQLVAPEVRQIQFRYYDGSQLTDTWDMKELKVLPIAIEVAVWVKSGRDDTGGGNDVVANTGHMYRQVVYLPMAPVSQIAANGGSASTTSSSTSTESSDTSSSNSGSGSAFEEQ